MLDNSTPSEALHAETVAILEAGGASRIRVEQDGRGWLVACVLDGSGRAGHTGIDPETSDDPRDMARRLIGPPAVTAEPAAITAPAPEPDGGGFVSEPEPAADALATDAPSESPPATDGGSFSDEYSAYFDETVSQAGGIGVMVNNTGGVMAADRTEELRAKKIGETVIEHRRLVDASYTTEEARRLQQLRSRSNGAAAGDLNPLTDDEQAELDRLAIEDNWVARMDAELQRRLLILQDKERTGADYLQSYSPRGGWE